MNTIKKIGTLCALVGAAIGSHAALESLEGRLAEWRNQNTTVPRSTTIPNAKIWITRYERIEIGKDRDGNKVWYTEPHDRSDHRVRMSITTFFKDGGVRIYDLDRDQTWDYGPEGTTMTDVFGNKYKVELKRK